MPDITVITFMVWLICYSLIAMAKRGQLCPCGIAEEASVQNAFMPTALSYSRVKMAMRCAQPRRKPGLGLPRFHQLLFDMQEIQKLLVPDEDKRKDATWVKEI